jgi:hypothetical protein
LQVWDKNAATAQSNQQQQQQQQSLWKQLLQHQPRFLDSSRQLQLDARTDSGLFDQIEHRAALSRRRIDVGSDRTRLRSSTSVTTRRSSQQSDSANRQRLVDDHAASARISGANAATTAHAVRGTTGSVGDARMEMDHVVSFAQSAQDAADLIASSQLATAASMTPEQCVAFFNPLSQTELDETVASWETRIAATFDIVGERLAAGTL